MKNPFRYGVRVGGTAFFDRTKVMRDICNALDGGTNVLLYGPRRYGKSSLVGEVLGKLRARGVPCVELNMMDVASLDDFVARYANQVYRELAPVTGSLKQIADLFKRVSPVVSIADDGRPELKFSIRSAKAGIDTLREVLELPEKLCPAGKRAVVALDEFQEVVGLGLGAQFERTMRSVVERQQNVSYIYLGSKTHLLERMFSTRSRPFYNSAQKFALTRPPVAESVDFVITRFSDVGIRLSRELAEKFVARIDNIPYYLQALGSWTFNAVAGRGARSVSAEDIEEGFVALYETERVYLEQLFIAHPQSQRLLLRALAEEPVSTFTEEYRLRHMLASTSTVNTALRRLMAESSVDSENGVYRLSNPLLTYHVANPETQKHTWRAIAAELPEEEREKIFRERSLVGGEAGQ